MSKMSDISETIEDLRKCVTTINEAINQLADMFSDDVVEETPPKEAPLTLEAVRAVLADKSREGHTAEIRSLLQKYGVSKLSQIDPTNYKALLTEAEVLTDAN